MLYWLEIFNYEVIKAITSYELCFGDLKSIFTSRSQRHNPFFLLALAFYLSFRSLITLECLFSLWFEVGTQLYFCPYNKPIFWAPLSISSPLICDTTCIRSLSSHVYFQVQFSTNFYFLRGQLYYWKGFTDPVVPSHLQGIPHWIPKTMNSTELYNTWFFLYINTVSLKGSTSQLHFGIFKLPASLLLCFGAIIR